jgi:hypothetical protein
VKFFLSSLFLSSYTVFYFVLLMGFVGCRKVDCAVIFFELPKRETDAKQHTSQLGEGGLNLCYLHKRNPFDVS